MQVKLTELQAKLIRNLLRTHLVDLKAKLARADDKYDFDKVMKEVDDTLTALSFL